MAGKKRKTTYKGFLTAQDATKWDKNDKDFYTYWNKVKDNLFILMDTIDPNNQDVIFLNREFKKIAKKYEGHMVKITIEPVYSYESIKDKGVPDLDEEYQGFEKFKRTIFTLFNIS